jgi:hypothetical protein
VGKAHKWLDSLHPNAMANLGKISIISIPCGCDSGDGTIETLKAQVKKLNIVTVVHWGSAKKDEVDLLCALLGRCKRCEMNHGYVLLWKYLVTIRKFKGDVATRKKVIMNVIEAVGATRKGK